MTSWRSSVDWILLAALIPIFSFGLATLAFFHGSNALFEKQLLWLALGLILFFILARSDTTMFRSTGFVVLLYGGCLLLLTLVLFFGTETNGAVSRFDFGGFSFQPSDITKLALILILAKYFSRRHVEIAHLKHIVVSGIYMILPFLLIMIEPDFGSAVILFLIWFGMVLVSGISKKHLFSIMALGVLAGAFLWMFVFAPYQKARIVTFINPLADVRGAGYNAYQSTIAVGSGGIFGKGIGYGTQSRLNFLPEYETDFVFAAFAEEWGFVGVVLLFLLLCIVMWRILKNATLGVTNFEMLYGMGLAIFLMSHIAINVGMNIGLLPVTGIPLPFMSYGGSHIITELVGLGILMGMRRTQRAVHRDQMKNEFLGI